MNRLLLKPEREKSVLHRHPWVFSGAIARVEGAPEPGDVVDVCDARGQFLARGDYSPHSQIVVRLLTWNADEAVDDVFWRQRLATTVARRANLAEDSQTDAYRLAYAESDSLPGLIVDRYGDWLVLQALTVGMERRKARLAEWLHELLAPTGVYERSDVDVRRHEGLRETAGALLGATPPALVEIHEHGLRFQVDLLRGHKTGFYLDQRDNRQRVGGLCAGRDVLNAFGYTGGFAVYAAAQGAHRVTSLDSSASALRLAEANLALNALGHLGESVEGDAFQVLRLWRDAGRQFDVIILDPPKFAFSKGQVEAATRGYKDINLLAMRLLRPGGILCTFSCSGLVSEDLFQKVLFGASVDAGREARILARLSQGPDHPVLLTFPEGAYLKGMILQVE